MAQTHMQPQVHIERRQKRVAVVTLDDPGRRNALSLQLCEDLVTTIGGLSSDPDVGAIVVTGAGSAFCAGADLSQLGDSSSDGLKLIYEGFMAVARCPIPTVAAVNGPAVGAGMNLALATDLRIVGPRGRFDCRFLNLGIHPGGGHTWMLRRIVGPQAASAMVLFGEVLDADASVERGLAWESTDAEATPRPGSGIGLSGCDGARGTLTQRQADALRRCGGRDTRCRTRARTRTPGRFDGGARFRRAPGGAQIVGHLQALSRRPTRVNPASWQPAPTDVHPIHPR